MQTEIIQFIPVLHRSQTVANKMKWVLIALLPGIVAYVWFFGPVILVSLLISTLTALLAESFFVKLRQRSVKAAISDGSAVVTAWLISLSVIPILPWWALIFITVFAMLVKHIYGGLGHNPFNPAMAAVCFLLLAFPVQTNRWYEVLNAPSWQSRVQAIFENADKPAEPAVQATETPDTMAEATQQAISQQTADRLSQATPVQHQLMAEKTDANAEATPVVQDTSVGSMAPATQREDAEAATDKAIPDEVDTLSSATPHIDAMASATPLSLLNPVQMVTDLSKDLLQPFYLQKMAGMHAIFWISLAYLAGGILLLIKRVIFWRMPVIFLATILLVSGLFWLYNPGLYAIPLVHLVTGGTVLGAFFIITDPVTSATTPKGQLLFAAGAGLLVCLIRALGPYPDGVALAVLIMNMLAPLLDRMTQPRPFGEKK